LKIVETDAPNRIGSAKVGFIGRPTDAGRPPVRTDTPATVFAALAGRHNGVNSARRREKPRKPVFLRNDRLSPQRPSAQ
jgi:hypothetical protein